MKYIKLFDNFEWEEPIKKIPINLLDLLGYIPMKYYNRN
jgi:hypothetical protein